MYRRQQELVWTGDTIEHMESALEELGLYERPARPPAMVFIDLTGYTRLTEEQGNRAAARLAGHARAGQTLVEDDVVRLCGGSDLRFEERGMVELKGIPHPVRIHEA